MSATRKFHTSCLHRALRLSESICRWIHMPVNDAGIAEVIYMTYLYFLLAHHLLTQVQECVKRLVGEATSQHLHNTWTKKLRPAISDSPVTVPDHAWSMEPSFQSHDVSKQLQDELQSSKSSRGRTLFVRVPSQVTRTSSVHIHNPRLFADDFNVSFLILIGSAFMRLRTKEKTDPGSLKSGTNAEH